MEQLGISTRSAGPISRQLPLIRPEDSAMRQHAPSDGSELETNLALEARLFLELYTKKQINSSNMFHSSA